MIRESCIEHNAKARSVIIKSDYLEVCEGDHCGAALLSLIEFWANGAITNNKKPPAKVRLGQFKAADLHWWLLGFYSTKRIMERIEKLRQRGFIEFEESANHKERTYWAHINVIQSALSSRQMSPDKCLQTNVSRQMPEQNPVTPDKCLDKDESVQTNVSTSIFSNSSSLSNYNLVAPPEPGAPPTQERVCVELKEVAKEDKLVVEPESNQQNTLATKQDSISTQVNETNPEKNQSSAAPRENDSHSRIEQRYPKNLDGSDRLPWETNKRGFFDTGFEEWMTRSLSRYPAYQQLPAGDQLTKVRKHISAGKHDFKRRDELEIEWAAYKERKVRPQEQVRPRFVAMPDNLTRRKIKISGI